MNYIIKLESKHRKYSVKFNDVNELALFLKGKTGIDYYGKYIVKPKKFKVTEIVTI